MNNLPLLMTVAHTAKFLGIAESSVRDLRTKGVLVNAYPNLNSNVRPTGHLTRDSVLKHGISRRTRTVFVNTALKYTDTTVPFQMLAHYVAVDSCTEVSYCITTETIPGNPTKRVTIAPRLMKSPDYISIIGEVLPALQGHKTLAFANNPTEITMLTGALTAHGFKVVRDPLEAEVYDVLVTDDNKTQVKGNEFNAILLAAPQINEYRYVYQLMAIEHNRESPTKIVEMIFQGDHCKLTTINEQLS